MAPPVSSDPTRRDGVLQLSMLTVQVLEEDEKNASSALLLSEAKLLILWGHHGTSQKET